MGSYEVETRRDFLHDFMNEHYRVFYSRLFAIGGTFGDVISIRSRFLKGDKMSKEERKAAYKCLNEEQLAMYEEQYEKSKLENGNKLQDTYKQIALQNREKNLKLQERR